MNDPSAPVVRSLLETVAGEGETFEPLCAGGTFRLERIVSRGASSPPGLWYDQERPEWVALVAGHATLELEADRRLELAAGDSLLLPAGCRHRVAATSPDTIWLALHFVPGRAEAEG